MVEYEINEKMVAEIKGLNYLEDFKGFGVDGYESRLDFVTRFNRLLWDYLTVCSDVNDKLYVAKKTSRNLNLLLDSTDDNLPAEINALRAYTIVYDKYSKMVIKEYQGFINTLDEEQLSKILDEASGVLNELDKDDLISRYYWILTIGRECFGIDNFYDDLIE